MPGNRNGMIGPYEEFERRRIPREEWAEEARRPRPTPSEREATVIADLQRVEIVRHRLASMSMFMDLREVGDNGSLYSPDTDDCTTILAIVDKRSRRAASVLIVHENERGYEISFKLDSSEITMSDEDLLDVLNLLDIPPSRRMGIDHQIAGKNDIWFDPDTGAWFRSEPTMLVVFEMRRTCFSTWPVLEERIDVYEPYDPSRPIDTGDEETDYQNARWYAAQAADNNGSGGAGRGFSSWMVDPTPKLVKVVGNSLDVALAEIAARRPEASPSTDPQRRPPSLPMSGR